MHVAKGAVPVRLSANGAIARQLEAVGDVDVVLFSPQAEHGEVLDHMAGALGGTPA